MSGALHAVGTWAGMRVVAQSAIVREDVSAQEGRRLDSPDASLRVRPLTSGYPAYKRGVGVSGCGLLGRGAFRRRASGWLLSMCGVCSCCRINCRVMEEAGIPVGQPSSLRRTPTWRPVPLTQAPPPRPEMGTEVVSAVAPAAGTAGSHSVTPAGAGAAATAWS